jgi:hypothetical protein
MPLWESPKAKLARFGESVWSKMKAKVALEIVNKAISEYGSHYSHPAEVGG